MPITPKPLVETDMVTTRFPKDLVGDLDAYCKYLGGASDRSYVIVEAVRQAIAKDRRYQRSLRTAAAAPASRNTTSDGRSVASGAGSAPARPPSPPDGKAHGAA